MPVCIYPFKHAATAVSKHGFVDSPVKFVNYFCGSSIKPVHLLQSSLDETLSSSAVRASTNGLVYSLINAYNQHHHLRLRPEDVWFAMLTQFSLFVNAHAEELRSKFVAHKGQEELVVHSEAPNRWMIDFSRFATQIGRMIEQNVIDPELRSWMIPDFSTSTKKDEVVANIVMMGSMQKYFTYKTITKCGIPSVTLLGKKEDWEKLLRKIDKFDEFGKEPKQFARLLRPIVRRFIRSFEDPQCWSVVKFWRQVVDYHGRSGVQHYSGWVTAFCFWNADGKRISPKIQCSRLILDWVSYPRIDGDDIPPGWTKVPVKIVDNGERVEAEMGAGSIGISCPRSEEDSEKGGVQLDTLQPETGWWIFEKTGLASTGEKAVKKFLSGCQLLN